MPATFNFFRQILRRVIRRCQRPPHDFWRDGIDLRLAGAKLARRRWVLLWSSVILALLSGAAMAFYVQLRAPAFTASSEILIGNTSLQMSGPDAVVTQMMVDVSLLESEIEVLKSSRVLEKTIDQIGAAALEAMLPQQADGLRLAPPAVKVWMQELFSALSPAAAPSVSTVDVRQALLLAMRAAINVKRLGSSTILSIRSTAATPDGAATLANALARAFVADHEQNNALVTTSASLRERIKVLGPSARIINEAMAPRFKDGPGGTLLTVAATIMGGCLGAALAGLGVCMDRGYAVSGNWPRSRPPNFLAPLRSSAAAAAPGCSRY